MSSAAPSVLVSIRPRSGHLQRRRLGLAEVDGAKLIESNCFTSLFPVDLPSPPSHRSLERGEERQVTQALIRGKMDDAQHLLRLE